MPRHSKLKPYATDIVREIRREQDRRNKRIPSYIDLAQVDRIKPSIIITPHHSTIEYDDDDLMFQINPDTLEIGDTVIIGQDPSGQPVVLGIADSSGGPLARDITELRTAIAQIKRGIKKLSITTVDNFLPKTGGTMTGDIIMSSGTKITLPDLPVNATDAVNKAYVDNQTLNVTTTTISDVDSPYMLLETDGVIFANTTDGNIDIVLPDTHTSGKQYIIKNIANEFNEVNIYSGDGDPIDGDPSFTITEGYQATTLVSDGSGWFVI